MTGHKTPGHSAGGMFGLWGATEPNAELGIVPKTPVIRRRYPATGILAAILIRTPKVGKTAGSRGGDLAALDVQFLLGLGLYATSPLVRSAWMNLAEAMKAHEQRFFALEHLTSMLLAIALAHASPSVTATRS
jgi:hypothetical protein